MPSTPTVSAQPRDDQRLSRGFTGLSVHSQDLLDATRHAGVLPRCPEDLCNDVHNLREPDPFGKERVDGDLVRCVVNRRIRIAVLYRAARELNSRCLLYTSDAADE